jgi:hypothetical protein
MAGQTVGGMWRLSARRSLQKYETAGLHPRGTEVVRNPPVKIVTPRASFQGPTDVRAHSAGLAG